VLPSFETPRFARPQNELPCIIATARLRLPLDEKRGNVSASILLQRVEPDRSKRRQIPDGPLSPTNTGEERLTFRPETCMQLP
jgi:hypothetical protein